MTRLRTLRDEEPLVERCDAFPAGIPAAILRNEADHRRPYDGDRGRLFEPEDGAAKEHADLVFGTVGAGS